MPVRIPGFTPTRRRVRLGGMVSVRRESDAEVVGGVGGLRGRGEEVLVVVLVGVEVEERDRERVIRVDVVDVGGVVRLRFRGEDARFGCVVVVVAVCFMDESAGGAEDVGFAVWKYWLRRPLKLVFLFTGTSLSSSWSPLYASLSGLRVVGSIWVLLSSRGLSSTRGMLFAGWLVDDWC